MAVGVQQQEEAASVGPTLKGKTKTLNTVAASEAKLDESKPCYYTWQQVAQHNRQESCWVIESGKVFDVTEFVSRHPGGNDFFMLAAGRDVTDLLPMYHWWTDKPLAVLRKFQIGLVTGPPEFISYPADKSGFYAELKQRVKHYFETTGKHPKDPIPGLTRLVGMFIGAAFTYSVCHVWTDSFSYPVRLFSALLYGVFQALPLLHAMHDASHSAIGTSPMGWTAISTLCMDVFAGASINSWLHQHILSHHVYTNVAGADADLPTAANGDYRRITQFQTWTSFYKYQWLFIPPLYTLLGLKFRYQDIFNTLIAKHNGPLRVSHIGYQQVIEQIIVKSLFVVWRILVPIFYFSVPTSQVLVMFLISELTTGGYLAYNFQVSHVSPIADFPSMEATNNKDTTPQSAVGGKVDEWAIHQVKTSIDYAHGDSIMTFLCGALNYQIEHHLFPAISQYHYPALAPIVMDVCKKHGIRYNYVPTFWDAFKLHLRHMWLMGMEKAGEGNVHVIKEGIRATWLKSNMD